MLKQIRYNTLLVVVVAVTVPGRMGRVLVRAVFGFGVWAAV